MDGSRGRPAGQADRSAGDPSGSGRAVPTAIPVTVKIRLGFENRELFLEIVNGIEDAGADEVTIHARTRKDGYRPPAYWDAIAHARESVSMPLIANGEIWSPDDAVRCRAASHCADLMLGRGVLCRPDLPRLIAAMDSGESIASLHWPDIVPLLLTFFELQLTHYDAHHAGNPLKQWLVYLRHYFPQAALLFEEVKRLRKPEDIERALARHAARVSRGRPEAA